MITSSIDKDKTLSYEVVISCPEVGDEVYNKATQISFADYESLMKLYSTIDCKKTKELGDVDCDLYSTDAGYKEITCHYDDGSSEARSFYDGCVTSNATVKNVRELSSLIDTIREKHITTFDTSRACPEPEEPESSSFMITSTSGYTKFPHTSYTSVSEGKVLSYRITATCDGESKEVYNKTASISEDDYNKLMTSYADVSCGDDGKASNSDCDSIATDFGSTIVTCFYDDDTEKSQTYYDGCIGAEDYLKKVNDLSSLMATIRGKYIENYDTSLSCN